MNIAKITTDPNALAYMERYVNGGSRTYSKLSSINEVSTRYQPTAASDAFGIPAVLVPQTAIAVYTDNPSSIIKQYYLQGENAVFVIHPETYGMELVRHLDALKKFPRIEGISATPTASTRTVLVQSPMPHFLKLHLPKQISRFVRRLRAVSVHFSVMISEDLTKIKNPSFGYLPETIGMTIGEGDEGWGFIVREPLPRPAVSEKRYYLPMFALYAKDMHAEKDEPLLVQLIRHHNADAATFTLEHIMKPLVISWCQAYRERGIVFGVHGQNALLEVNEELTPTRVIHRDLDLQIDPLLRRQKGLATDFPKSRIGIEVNEPRERALSLKYDMFMGHHLFEYLAKTLDQYFSVRTEILQDAIRGQFQKSLPNWTKYFDDRTYYYAPKPSEFNEYILVPHGAPEWR